MNLTSLVIVKHSLGDHLGGPAEALERYLSSSGQTFQVISHPLDSRSDLTTLIKTYEQGLCAHKKQSQRTWSGLFTYVTDLFHTPRIDQGSYVFCFNPWAVLLAKIRSKKDCKIIFWGVDFVPKATHFNFHNFFYKTMESVAFRFVDVQIETNSFAFEQRRKSLGKIIQVDVPNLIIPITHNFSEERLIEGDIEVTRIIYVGSLDRRNGAHQLVAVAEELRRLKVSFNLDIVGTGSAFSEIVELVQKYGLSDFVQLHGHLPDEEIPRLARQAQFGLAPYEFKSDAFTIFADPGKLVFYAAFGLVGVVSEVPLIVKEYESHAGFLVMKEEFSPREWAKSIGELSSNPDLLWELRSKSFAYGKSRESKLVFGGLLKELITNGDNEEFRIEPVK